MYVRDYDLNLASDKKQKPKDMPLVPEEERDREETNIFSYGYAYTKKHMYITIFLMPWIPEVAQGHRRGRHRHHHEHHECRHSPAGG